MTRRRWLTCCRLQLLLFGQRARVSSRGSCPRVLASGRPSGGSGRDRPDDAFKQAHRARCKTGLGTFVRDQDGQKEDGTSRGNDPRDKHDRKRHPPGFSLGPQSCRRRCQAGTSGPLQAARRQASALPRCARTRDGRRGQALSGQAAHRQQHQRRFLSVSSSPASEQMAPAFSSLFFSPRSAPALGVR